MSVAFRKIFLLTTVACFFVAFTSVTGCELLEEEKEESNEELCEKACDKILECGFMDEEGDEGMTKEDCLEECEGAVADGDISKACEDCFDMDDCMDVAMCFEEKCGGGEGDAEDFCWYACEEFDDCGWLDPEETLEDCVNGCLMDFYDIPEECMDCFFEMSSCDDLYYCFDMYCSEDETYPEDEKQSEEQAY